MTLIEIAVVLFILALLIAVITPTFAGASVQATDSQAQSVTRLAAAEVGRVFAASGSYQNITPSQLGCPSTNPCGNGATWNAYGINWYYQQAGGAGADNTQPDVAAVLSWGGSSGGDTATTVATWAPAPANACWFITLHSQGPSVYGFFQSPSALPGCSGLWTCWPENAQPFNFNGGGNTWYSGCGNGITVASPLPTTSFPLDPNA